MKKIILTATAVLSSLLTARASEMSIYPTFAEIRETVQVSGSQYEWTPNADLSQFLIPGSLELSDPSVTSMSLRAAPPSLLTMFEGKEVKVWFHEKFVVATVVKAELYLFKIDGEYIQLPNAEVLFPNIDGIRYAPTYTWQRTGAATSATLQYATSAVAWNNTRYTLNTQDTNSTESKTSSLTAWAEISNQSSVVYQAPKATLFAGDVQPQYAQDNLQQAQNRNIAFAPSQGGANSVNRPRVVSSGEVGGLQRFDYPQPLRLEAKSSLSLPFIRSTVETRRILEYTGDFDTTTNFKAAMFRTYRFVAAQGLPAGIFTVRENNQLVGQSEIANTAKNTIVKINLGKDFDIKINRSAQVLERTNKIERARIVFTIQNTKSRAINIRMVETLEDNIKLEVSGVKGLKRVPGAFTLESEIAAGKTLTLTLLSTEKF
jgi:hypothetical protein